MHRATALSHGFLFAISFLAVACGQRQPPANQENIAQGGRGDFGAPPPQAVAEQKRPVPSVRLSEKDPQQFLDWLTKTSEGPRAVELSGNELAYESALAKMYASMKGAYGTRVTWSLKIGKIAKAGISFWPEVLYSPLRKYPMFVLRAGKAYEPAGDNPNDKVLRWLSVEPPNEDWVFALRKDEMVDVTGIVSEIIYIPSRTARSPNRDPRKDRWGYDFYVILNNVEIARSH